MKNKKRDSTFSKFTVGRIRQHNVFFYLMDAHNRLKQWLQWTHQSRSHQARKTALPSHPWKHFVATSTWNVSVQPWVPKTSKNGLDHGMEPDLTIYLCITHVTIPSVIRLIGVRDHLDWEGLMGVCTNYRTSPENLARTDTPEIVWVFSGQIWYIKVPQLLPVFLQGA